MFSRFHRYIQYHIQSFFSNDPFLILLIFWFKKGGKCDNLMWKFLFCGLIEVWILNLELEIVFEVCGIMVEFWRIMVYANEIGGVWGIAMGRGKLKIEGRRRGKIQMGFFEFYPKISYEFNYHKLSGCSKILKILL